MATKPVFAKPQIKLLRDFSKGLNDRDNPLLIDDAELAEVQNFHLDEKGTLKKRTGYTKRYSTTFATGPVRSLYNYRREDGTSRLVIAADDKLFSDSPQFLRLYDEQSDWESAGTAKSGVSATRVTDSIVLSAGLSGMLGHMVLGRLSAVLGSGLADIGTRTATWTSEAIDVSAVVDKSTGIITVVQSVPTGTTVTIETRTSPDALTWSAYAGLGPGNTIVSPGADYLQVRVSFSATSTANPSVSSLQITYDATPATTQITSGLSTLARYTFATQNDTLFIVNGENANKKWDATTLSDQGGSPPVGKYVIVHSNRMFIAGVSGNRSRLYFSDLADPESWPALNFIDVGKGDGDTITGFGILYNQLIVTKEHSVWVLQGDAASNFVLRRATDEGGASAMYSMIFADNTLAWMEKEGVRFFDGVRSAIASEKIKGTIDGLSERQLALVAGVSFDDKLYFAAPEGSSTRNDAVLVFDTHRAAWVVYRGLEAGTWCVFRQFQADRLLFGSSLTGQVYEMDDSLTDDGTAIDAFFVTKAVDFGAPLNQKRMRAVWVTCQTPEGTSTTAEVHLRKDLGSDSAAKTISLGAVDINVERVIPSALGIATGRTLGIKVRHNGTLTGFHVFEIGVTVVQKAIRESV